MMSVAFDTLKTTRALEGRGFSREQAEAVAEIVAESRAIDLSHLATRDDLTRDIATVRAEAAANKTELKNDIATVRSEIAAVKSELKNDIATVRAEIVQLEQRMTIKLGGMLVIVTGILLAAIRYLPPH